MNEATLDTPLEAVMVRIVMKDVSNGDVVSLSIFGCYERVVAEMSEYYFEYSMLFKREQNEYSLQVNFTRFSVSTLTTVASTTPGVPG